MRLLVLEVVAVEVMASEVQELVAAQAARVTVVKLWMEAGARKVTT